MSVSNCSSCGADSYTAPITGVVSRRDKVTGQEQLATVRPNGIPEAAKAETPAAVTGVSLSSAVLGAVLQASQV